MKNELEARLNQEITTDLLSPNDQLQLDHQQFTPLLEALDFAVQPRRQHRRVTAGSERAVHDRLARLKDASRDG